VFPVFFRLSGETAGLGTEWQAWFYFCFVLILGACPNSVLQTLCQLVEEV
jgi:hypothetical protein